LTVIGLNEPVFKWCIITASDQADQYAQPTHREPYIVRGPNWPVSMGFHDNTGVITITEDFALNPGPEV
jgi:hypothetical protein